MKMTSVALVAAALVFTAFSATAVTHNVTVGPGGLFTFSPADVTVAVGDTVHWVWDSGGHNVVSGVPGSPTPYFSSGPPDLAGTTFDVVFDAAFLIANPVPGGVYDYFCQPHGSLFGMVGSVGVGIDTRAPDEAVSWGRIKELYR